MMKKSYTIGAGGFLEIIVMSHRSKQLTKSKHSKDAAQPMPLELRLTHCAFFSRWLCRNEKKTPLSCIFNKIFS